MKLALVLVMSTTLIFSTSHSALSQARRRLVLVKGDTPKSQSCSFITAGELVPVDISQRLLGIEPGFSPDEVRNEMGFPPDQPEGKDSMQWTATQGGQYVKAFVKFRNKGAVTRLLTLATNYQQPNQKQCWWEVREEDSNIQAPSSTVPSSNQ